jgi:3-deoxy-manno-octulosonate cytidylyltransferase (CMP-KDO synthetase)
VAEVAEKLSEDLILNLQGDEPLVPRSTVRALVEFVAGRPNFAMASAMVPLPREADIINPNIVKVVVSTRGEALYFSRCPIPYRKDAPLNPAADERPGRSCAGYFKHVGIYIYRRAFLLKYVKLSPTPLEVSESLEQLRALEHGYTIQMVQVEQDSISVDTPEDALLVESLIEGQQQ